jgi:hypothetical protein
VRGAKSKSKIVGLPSRLERLSYFLVSSVEKHQESSDRERLSIPQDLSLSWFHHPHIPYPVDAVFRPRLTCGVAETVARLASISWVNSRKESMPMHTARSKSGECCTCRSMSSHRELISCRSTLRFQDGLHDISGTNAKWRTSLS